MVLAKLPTFWTNVVLTCGQAEVVKSAPKQQSLKIEIIAARVGQRTNGPKSPEMPSYD
jgi:hypothetical protein